MSAVRRGDVSQRKMVEHKEKPASRFLSKWACDTRVIHHVFIHPWEIGFQSEVKLHKTPTKKDIENGYRENELIALFDLPAHWLMSQMNAYCVGANFVFHDGKHYYTVHHA